MFSPIAIASAEDIQPSIGQSIDSNSKRFLQSTRIFSFSSRVSSSNENVIDVESCNFKSSLIDSSNSSSFTLGFGGEVTIGWNKIEATVGGGLKFNTSSSIQTATMEFKLEWIRKIETVDRVSFASWDTNQIPYNIETHGDAVISEIHYGSCAVVTCRLKSDSSTFLADVSAKLSLGVGSSSFGAKATVGFELGVQIAKMSSTVCSYDFNFFTKQTNCKKG